MTGLNGTPEQSIALPIATYTYGASAAADGKLVYRKTQAIPLPVDEHQDLTGISTSVFSEGVAPLGAMITQQNLVDLNGDGRLDLLKAGAWMRNTPVSGGKSAFPAADAYTLPGSGLSQNFIGQIQQTAQARAIVFGTTGQSQGYIHHQLIDFNGDGRLDLLADGFSGPAIAAPGTWTVLLNTPDPSDPNKIVWVSRSISTAPLTQALIAAGYVGIGSDPATAYLPLAAMTTTNDSLFNQCWKWDTDSNGVLRWILTIAGYSGPDDNRCAGPQGQLPSADGYASIDGPKKTITEWEVRDINGDGYPDFVYNASQMANVLGPNTPPQVPGSFVGQFQETRRTATSDIGGSRDVKALLNIAGVHLDTTLSAGHRGSRRIGRMWRWPLGSPFHCGECGDTGSGVRFRGRERRWSAGSRDDSALRGRRGLRGSGAGHGGCERIVLQHRKDSLTGSFRTRRIGSRSQRQPRPYPPACLSGSHSAFGDGCDLSGAKNRGASRSQRRRDSRLHRFQ
jgi:hypothetical protein